MLELFLSLAREADDDVSGDSRVGRQLRREEMVQSRQHAFEQTRSNQLLLLGAARDGMRPSLVLSPSQTPFTQAKNSSPTLRSQVVWPQNVIAILAINRTTSGVNEKQQKQQQQKTEPQSPTCRNRKKKTTNRSGLGLFSRKWVKPFFFRFFEFIVLV